MCSTSASILSDEQKGVCVCVRSPPKQIYMALVYVPHSIALVSNRTSHSHCQTHIVLCCFWLQSAKVLEPERRAAAHCVFAHRANVLFRAVRTLPCKQPHESERHGRECDVRTRFARARSGEKTLTARAHIVDVHTMRALCMHPSPSSLSSSSSFHLIAAAVVVVVIDNTVCRNGNHITSNKTQLAAAIHG